MQPFKFAKNIKLGSATASAQIEGGDKLNNWYRWCQMGKIKDKTNCFEACDHINRYKEDIDLMKEMKHEVYRMSIEWSRIEPAEGKYNRKGMEFYKKEIQYLIKQGIEPMITLHHFSEPIWFEDFGGWTNNKSIFYFLRFAKRVVLELGDLVSNWVTINEPNVHLLGSYLAGIFPPGEHNVKKYFKAANNMIIAHIKTYNLIHRICDPLNNGTTYVGYAHHIACYDTDSNKAYEKIVKYIIEKYFDNIFLEGMMTGNFLPPLRNFKYKIKKGKYYDFIGVNYYTRHIIKLSYNPKMFFIDLLFKKGRSYNDLGWEFYPEGLYSSCKKLYKRFNKPIFITENGLCDSKDKYRSKFIYDHLYQINRLIKEDIPVLKYYHWSTMDNFEWQEGLVPRFGLVNVDYKTQKRTVRKSGMFYTEIIKNKGVTQEMIDEYL